jgi:hypothetical protein
MHGKLALELLAFVGIAWTMRDPRGPVFNGRDVNVMTARTPSLVLHELAHFMVASRRDPARALKPNFGLGRAYAGSTTRCTLPIDICRAEEALASVLGICFEASLGMDFARTLYTHGWSSTKDEPDWSSAEEELAELRSLGLINGSDHRDDLCPTLLSKRKK